MKGVRKLNSKNPFQPLIMLVLLFVIAACGQQSTKSSDEDAVAEEAVTEELDVWVIDEHQINDIPITSKAPKAKAKTDDQKAKELAAKEAEEEANEEAEEEANEEAEEEELYEIYTMAAIQADLEEQEYEATQVVEYTEIAVPLDETQTVVSYNKKGKEEAAFQVVSSGPDNEVEQIIFTDKKHTDVYDVSTGMSAKEVKKLRKEMKHMVKKGKVYLYDDQSNIMYLMDAQDAAGDEVTAEDVESMDVQAVIWKDKKHHKKN